MEQSLNHLRCFTEKNGQSHIQPVVLSCSGTEYIQEIHLDQELLNLLMRKEYLCSYLDIQKHKIFFKLYITEQIIDHVVAQTNLYA